MNSLFLSFSDNLIIILLIYKFKNEEEFIS